MRLALDASVRLHRGGRVLVAHGRIIRLTEHGPAALRALLADTATPAQRRLGRRLVAAGMAHPRPAPQHRPATIVIPVRDRPDDLGRLLAIIKGSDPLTLCSHENACSERNRFVEGSDPHGGVVDPHGVVVVDDGSAVPVEGAVRRERAGGPGAARNTGLEHVDTELVAFLDSDTVPPRDWIERLAGHFDDPEVAAVAPRVTGKLLDMGARPSEVGPGRPVPYVPAAALLVRVSALPTPAFDPELRYGEDVDLIWRLIDAGRRVRYDPSVTVAHEERGTLKRRFLYGTSAAPLQHRHPDKLRHVTLKPWPTATLALLIARRPRAAAAAYAIQTARVARVLRAHGAPARAAPGWTARAIARTAAQFAKLATPYGAGVAYGYARRSRGRRV